MCSNLTLWLTRNKFLNFNFSSYISRNIFHNILCSQYYAVSWHLMISKFLVNSNNILPFVCNFFCCFNMKSPPTSNSTINIHFHIFKFFDGLNFLNIAGGSVYNMKWVKIWREGFSPPDDQLFIPDFSFTNPSLVH